MHLFFHLSAPLSLRTAIRPVAEPLGFGVEAALAPVAQALAGVVHADAEGGELAVKYDLLLFGEVFAHALADAFAQVDELVEQRRGPLGPVGDVFAAGGLAVEQRLDVLVANLHELGAVVLEPAQESAP